MQIEIDDENLNYPMRDTLTRLLDKASRAKSVDVIVRRDGVETLFQADWLKYAKVKS